jgi:tRNA 2-thiouridine synthesizing protein A
MSADDAVRLRHSWHMSATKLDLKGLKYPFSGLDDAKGAESAAAGRPAEVHCTDSLSVIDIPNLIPEAGDKVEITERAEQRFVFLIEKTGGLPAAATASAMPDQDRDAVFSAPQQ